MSGWVPKGSISRAAHPDKFGAATVKFDQTLTLPLESDAHVIVVGDRRETASWDRSWARPRGKQEARRRSANPIFVDFDGNGFQPNRDTLGYPLPVKYVAPARSSRRRTGSAATGGGSRRNPPEPLGRADAASLSMHDMRSSLPAAAGMFCGSCMHDNAWARA